ncbi:MAG: glycosyltransferase family 2 protein [Planctomycetes bacterium]|nr:glycosyltransferase family 2 protein [Planctomycetota bacterium]
MLSIVVPSFNEKPNVLPLLAAIDNALGGVVEYEVVFVDDSSDDTPALLHKLYQENPRIRYLHRENGDGLASAVVEGFGLAKGDVIAVMDADLQHPPSLLAPMYHAIQENADIVLPSRYVNGGGSEGLSFIRMLASKSARVAGQIFLKSMRKVSDPMSGYFMFRRSVIDGVRLNPLGWKVLMEVLVLGKYRTVVELPYHFEKRNAGESKLSFKVTLQYFMHILSLVVRSERDRRFFLFALVGLSGVVVDMAIFIACTSWSSISINAAATISAVVAMVSNYILNRTVTWKSKSKNISREFAKYAATSIVGIGIKNVCVYLLVRIGMSGIWSNLIGIVVACVWNYFLSSVWVFRSGEKNGSDEIVYIQKKSL